MVHGASGAELIEIIKAWTESEGKRDQEILSAAMNPQPRWPWPTAEEFRARLAEASQRRSDRAPFEIVWSRIADLQGEQFTTITGLPFTFRIDGDALYPSRTDYRLSRHDFERAYALVPIRGPGTINNEVRGPAYIWAILHDERVSQGAWRAPA